MLATIVLIIAILCMCGSYLASIYGTDKYSETAIKILLASVIFICVIVIGMQCGAISSENVMSLFGLYKETVAN